MSFRRVDMESSSVSSPRIHHSFSADMDSEEEVLQNGSHASVLSSSSRSANINTKILENQRLGFHLADELRTLREDLLATKQEKRLLGVTNQNLSEQLTKAEERIRQLEDAANINLTAIRRLERINAEESQHNITLQEQLTRLQAEHRHQKQLYSTSSEQLSSANSNLRTLSDENRKLRQYSHTLEAAVEELNKLNEEKESELASLRSRFAKLELRLASMERRENVLAANISDGLDEIGLVSSNRKDASPASSPLFNTSPGNDGCTAKLESAVKDFRKRTSLIRNELKKSKVKAVKLLKIIKYYEEMLPLHDALSAHDDDP